MNSQNYIPKGNQSGAATSAAKVNRREGTRAHVGKVYIAGKWETWREIKRSVDHSVRNFWAKRSLKGIYCNGPTFDGQMRAAAQRKACA